MVSFRSNFIIPILSIILFFVAPCCKKDSKTHPDNTNSNASGIYGSLQVDKNLYYIHDSLISTTYGASARFTYNPNNFDYQYAIQVDTIRINGVCMKWNPNSFNYFDTLSMGMAGPPQPIAYPFTISVTGNSIIPSFNYTESGPYPAFTNFLDIPDTISKNIGVTISLSGIANGDILEYYIVDNQGQYIYQEILAPLPSSITFSPAMFAAFMTTNNGNINFKVTKKVIQTYNSKSFNNFTVFSFGKKIIIT